MNSYVLTLLGIITVLLLTSIGFTVYHFKVRRRQVNPPPFLTGFYGMGVTFPLLFSLVFGMVLIAGLNSPPPDSEVITNLLKKQVPNATLQRIDFVEEEPRAWVLLAIGERKNVLVQAVYAQGEWQLNCLDSQGSKRPLSNPQTATLLQRTAQCG